MIGITPSRLCPTAADFVDHEAPPPMGNSCVNVVQRPNKIAGSASVTTRTRSRPTLFSTTCPEWTKLLLASMTSRSKTQHYGRGSARIPARKDASCCPPPLRRRSSLAVNSVWRHPLSLRLRFRTLCEGVRSNSLMQRRYLGTSKPLVAHFQTETRSRSRFSCGTMTARTSSSPASSSAGTPTTAQSAISGCSRNGPSTSKEVMFSPDAGGCHSNGQKIETGRRRRGTTSRQCLSSRCRAVLPLPRASPNNRWRQCT